MSDEDRKSAAKSDAVDLANPPQSSSGQIQGIAPGFGRRLKEERMRLKKTQEAFSEIGGVGRLSQIQYEKEKTDPTTGYLKRIAAAGVDLAYLMFGARSAIGISRENLDRIDLRAFEMVESHVTGHPVKHPSAEARWMLYRVFRNYLIQVEAGQLPANAAPGFIASLFLTDPSE